jgi:phosphatidylserine decarboxylase
MRIPLTSYGWPQVIIWPIVIIVIAVVFSAAAAYSIPPWIVFGIDAILIAILVWALSFFRDPQRDCPSDIDVLLAPADGKITDITTLDDMEFIGGKALRIGIFLSIFNVHINRSPCKAKVEKTEHRPGRYKNALNPESSLVNESNNLYLTRLERPHDRLIVRQVSGAIARRIVCKASPGQHLSAGEKFGMIKFGSRTELYVPSHHGVRCLVVAGQPVKAGLTILVRYESCQG